MKIEKNFVFLAKKKWSNNFGNSLVSNLAIVNSFLMYLIALKMYLKFKLVCKNLFALILFIIESYFYKCWINLRKLCYSLISNQFNCYSLKNHAFPKLI